jgi:hypothetical protein
MGRFTEMFICGRSAATPKIDCIESIYDYPNSHGGDCHLGEIFHYILQNQQPVLHVDDAQLPKHESEPTTTTAILSLQSLKHAVALAQKGSAVSREMVLSPELSIRYMDRLKNIVSSESCPPAAELLLSSVGLFYRSNPMQEVRLDDFNGLLTETQLFEQLVVGADFFYPFRSDEIVDRAIADEALAAYRKFHNEHDFRPFQKAAPFFFYDNCYLVLPAMPMTYEAAEPEHFQNAVELVEKMEQCLIDHGGKYTEVWAVEIWHK